MNTPRSMRNPLRYGLTYKPEKKNTWDCLGVRSRSTIQRKYIFEVKQFGSNKLQCIQHPELVGNWNEMVEHAKKMNYDGIKQVGGLKRQAMFEKQLAA